MPELDGLRGLAAFSVFVGHAIGIAQQTGPLQTLQNSPLRFLWNGGNAVVLFFVLSGFVLSLPFIRGSSNLNYWRFTVLRAFRIYPAYWAALGVSLICIAALAPAPPAGLSPWANEFLQLHVSAIPAQQFLYHILLVTSFNTVLIDPPSWTLTVEMRMSLVIPLLIVVFRGRSNWLRTGCLVLFVVLGARIGSLGFLPMFALGVALACYWDDIRVRAAALGKPALYILLAISIVLYGNVDILHAGLPRYWTGCLTAAGSAGLMVLATVLPAARGTLNTSPVQFLGRISYSFYLLHFPLLFLVTSRLYPLLGSVAAVTAVSLPLICLASHLSFRFIERPMIKLSRELVGKRPRECRG